ncbi:unnamed protein product [Leptidea sinapis]|uniref:Uncharacterized protein n=1 Tax=Leptidea sinapis TaxID=189913 RepID=A0A5E4QLU3_9NEOP|nr:unnamed protein product [Leptidea sinapis]
MPHISHKIHKMSTRKNSSFETTKHKTYKKHILIPILVILLPYSLAINLPSGDPAPGRSPGPPINDEISDKSTNIEVAEVFYDETTESDVTTVEAIISVDDDACAYAKVYEGETKRTSHHIEIYHDFIKIKEKILDFRFLLKFKFIFKDLSL